MARAIRTVNVAIEDGVIVDISVPADVEREWPDVANALYGLVPEGPYCFCGLALDIGQRHCGIDPACRRQALMEYGEAVE